MTAHCPRDIPDIQCERRGHVAIWWFPRDFSQSRYGDRNTGSNACTLIALLMAQHIYQDDVRVWVRETGCLAGDIVSALGDSIMEGNQIHEELLRKGALRHVNMTVPEAMEAAGPRMKFLTEWKSLVYLMDLGESLFDQLSECVTEWYRNPPPRRGSDLYVVLIADNRSVLLVFQRDLDRVTLIDSHQHTERGAVLAQAALSGLHPLCLWYHGMLHACYGARPACYELSYLYFKCYDAGEMAAG